jgi:hypothetical protein
MFSGVIRGGQVCWRKCLFELCLWGHVNGGDAREDETIQSTLLKIIERADAKTVTEVSGISILSET